MSIPNPYARDQERAAALASVVPALETLAAEYWAIGRRLCDAVTTAHSADFRTADETFDAFVVMGEALKAEGFVDRVDRSMAERFNAMGYQAGGQDGTTDRQKAGWGLSEMISTGISGDRPRFDVAYSAVTADSVAEPHLRPMFREAGTVWMTWLYCPHVEGFRKRAGAILTPINWPLSTHTLRRFPLPLSDAGYAAFATWAEWEDSLRTVVPVRVSDSGPGIGFPVWLHTARDSLEVETHASLPPVSPADEPNSNREDQEKLPEFVFAPSGNGYVVCGFGQSGHLQRLRGLHDVSLLLRNAGKPVAMLDLDQRGDDEKRDRQTVQPALDERAWTEALQQRARLEAEITSAEDEVERADSQRALDELNQAISSATGRKGEARDLNSPFDKLRPKIYGRIMTVFRKLRDAIPPMGKIAEHLEQSISAIRGDSFIYRPTETSPAWVFVWQK